MSSGQALVLLVGPFLVMIAVSLPYGAAASFLSPALDEIIHGSGAVVAGVGLGLVGAGVIVGRTFAGLVSDRQGPGSMVWPGLGLAATGMVGIAVMVSMAVNPWWFSSPRSCSASDSVLCRTTHWWDRSNGCPARAWGRPRRRGTSPDTGRLGSIVMGGLAGFGYVVLFAVAAGIVVIVGGPAAVHARRTRPPRELPQPDSGD